MFPPGFGKSSIAIGSSPECDIHLTGASVRPIHARIVHEGGGKLVFHDEDSGSVTCNGVALAKGGQANFDFRAQFQLGGVSVPLAHRAYALMLMAPGQLPKEPSRLVLGRDPARVHVVITHPNISGQHATVTHSPFAIVDHNSTSGTWAGGERLVPNVERTLDPNLLLSLGPVPLPCSVLLHLLGEQSALASFAPAPAAPPTPGTGLVSSNAEPGARRHKTVLGQIAMGPSNTEAQTIGRTKDNSIPIEHPQVSSKHAFLHHSGGQLFIEDRGSANGTFVRGQRIAAHQRVAVSPGEKVFIGPMPLLLQTADSSSSINVVVEDHTQDWAGRPLYEIEAWDLVVQVPDRDKPGELKTLLDRVSFKALPGDFIALMGPSGAGKTTLLLTLNGYLPPTSGQVRINGEDLYSIYDALRGSIGYVPQDDIVHPELTVREAVRFSAKFRLPPDYEAEEIERRVDTTLQQLGLEGVQHLQIGAPEKKVLSGGQRKRVNIAMELVTDPVIMFLDEPTSGLAADDTAALVRLLSELAKATGKTIITTIHQPAKDEFEKFNLCLIMGAGGIPIFYGPTAPDAYNFFGTQRVRTGHGNRVDNPRDMFDMLNLREKEIFDEDLKRNPQAPRVLARQKAARLWASEFFSDSNPTYQRMFSGARSVGTGTGRQGIPTGRPKTRGQFGLLFSRYSKVKFRDKAGIWIMLLQAPIIGVLLAIVFGGQKVAIPFWCLGALQELSKRTSEAEFGTGSADLLKRMRETPDHSAAIFFLVVAAIWFGTSNAAREVVSERAIYLRERMVNLGLFNYIFSKFAFLTLACTVQCGILLSIVFFSLGFHGGPEAFLIGLGNLVVVSMNSAALGLLLSSMVVSSEAAMALTPIALIPQVVLGGLMVPMTTNPMLKWFMYVMPARWGFQGMVAEERRAILSDPAWVIDLNRPNLTSLDNFIEAGHFKCAQAQIASDTFTGAWGFTNYELRFLPPSVLGGMMLVTLLSILLILKRGDRV